MAVFTRLSPEDLAAISSAFGLTAVRRARPITAGTINSNFEVETDRGRWFVRVNEGKSEADVAWEVRLIEALGALGIPTPRPLPAEGGRRYAQLPDARKWVSVFPWQPGRHLAADEVTPAHACELGTTLARLHVAGQGLPVEWRRGSIYDHDHLEARFARFQASLDPALARAIAVLGEELTAAADAAELRRAATTGIIHGDLFRDNVLWDDGRIVALLDFEQASGGSLAYDLAVCIHDWCWTGRPRLDLIAPLLDGYRAVRPLTEADRLALPIELRAAAARFTITRVTDVYLARVDNPDKDFRAFLARCEAWRGPILGQVIELL